MKHTSSISSAPERGFTLVETLVAIAILMITIAIPFYSLQQAITASQVARDQVIASSLAQEGAEYIYFIRNNNYLYFKQNNVYSGASGWLSSLDSCLTTTSPGIGCTVDPAQSSIAACPSAGCSPLYLNSSNLYTQSATGATLTRFTRTVRVESLSATSARVTVTVTWISVRRAYTVTVTETLYNWL